MVLTIGIRATRLWLEVVSHQARLFDQLLAVTRPLFFREIVIKQVIAPTQTVKQMAGGQINVRLVVGVTPDVITDGRVHVLAGGVEIFLIAFDLVNESRFSDSDPHRILFASLLRRWWRRISGQSPHVA